VDQPLLRSSIRPHRRRFYNGDVFLFVIGKQKPVVDLDRDRTFHRIRCPQCQWQPQKHDTWVCSPGCGHVWNTFETLGVCPGCLKHWFETACHRCGTWSLHDDWYEQHETR
jgi:hypothetical protein